MYSNATPIDSQIYGDIFSTSAMREVWSDQTRIQRYLDVERALARAQGKLGIIPMDAAQEIEAHCCVEEMDFGKLQSGTEHIGYPVLPVVQQLTALCKDGLGQWCHWGATTQDITDTATVLQIRASLQLVETDLSAVAASLADLAAKYRDTPMVGRSNLQQETPMTFGYKAAVWFAGIDRRLRVRFAVAGRLKHKDRRKPLTWEYTLLMPNEVRQPNVNEYWRAYMIQENYTTLHLSLAAGVAHVTIDNPPVNVLDVRLMSELRQFLAAVRDDTSVKVIVFESADPDFFITHVDMTLVDAPHAFDELAKDAPEGLNVFQAFDEIVRHQPQVTIVKLAGMARGGGAEFVAAADMSFAAIGLAGLAQCEALMGIVPGGGGTQYLAKRLGHARALEVVLGADLFDAETAERYGWVNRALPADQINTFVDRLARHIAALPDGVVAAAKRAVPPDDLSPGLMRENKAWADLSVLPPAETLIRGGLAHGAQTRNGERRLEELLRDLSSEA